MKKVYSLNELSAEQYKKLKRKKIDVIRVLNPVSKALETQIKNEGISLVVQSNFTELMDVGYINSSQLVKAFSLSNSQIFKRFNLEIEAVLIKHLLWSRLEKVRLRHIMDKYPISEYTYSSYLNSFKNDLKARVKILYNLTKPTYSLRNTSRQKKVKDKLIIRVNNTFQIKLIEKVLQKLPRDSFVFLSFSEISNLPEAYKHVPVITYSKFKNNHSNIGLLSALKLVISKNPDESADAIDAVNSTFYYKQIYECLCIEKPRGLFFLAGENDASVLIACKVAKTFGIETYNYMNGIKGNTPSNLDTQFYKWFMHDTTTKQMLLQYDENLTEQGCPVVGHLESDNFHEDLINPGYNEYLSDEKTVITVFGSPIYHHEKQSVLNSISKHIDESIYIIYYKPHPNEYIDLKNSNHFKLINSKEKEVNRKLIVASTLIISFASTLALEASFLNNNVWNVEFRELSISPAMDKNPDITSLKSESQVEAQIKTIDDLNYSTKLKTNSNVSSAIVNHLNLGLNSKLQLL